ncbi:cytochrome P450 [Aaosphaeria arxii CBS 175.79]|uniref:Cytochrome P450 n=1 Tax=Aaosphaeria arxii CBS 175.79 TaxID=1450172 RepID=A0A6A5XN65_9PLEO|nr:cytochrome P450 [Aaosphaeria arxii CBS 175.79]KAF2014336.1 cytochrome P450 [Aaosphaeria arxii CBS 175.79]
MSLSEETQIAFAYLAPIVIFAVARQLYLYISSSHSSRKPWRRFQLFEFVRRIVTYHIRGAELIEEGYQKSNGRPYRIRTLRNNLVIVSSDEHTEELASVPDTILSLHAVAKDMFEPQHTMYGFKVHDKSPLNGSMHSRVLRTLLTSKIPYLLPGLRDLSLKCFRQQIALHGKSSPSKPGFQNIPTFEVSRRLVSQINSYCFVGPELAQNEEFVTAAGDFAQEVMVTGEILQFFPRALAPIIASLSTNFKRSERILVSYLRTTILERIRICEDNIPHAQRPVDCIQWIVETMIRKSDYNVDHIIQEFLALWFGSVHQVSMSLVYALYHLIDNPTQIGLLREEMSSVDDWTTSLSSLPNLDRLLVESAKLHPSDSISMRRKALQTYRFRDGTVVNKGDWVCVPLRRFPAKISSHAIPSHQSSESSGKTDGGLNTSFTNLGADFPLWGMGKHACPGRFYASSILKLLVGNIIMNFDIDIDAVYMEEKRRTFIWRTAVVPRASIHLGVRRRDMEEGEVKSR